jgi:3-phenylpropionate/cinnamic acid dioxygenase small subunit
MDRALKITEARTAIEDIVYRYAEAIDLGDLETVGELFAKGRVVISGGDDVTGTQDVLDLYTDLVKFYDEDENVVPYERFAVTPRTRHVTTNLIFEFNDAVTEAGVRSYFSVYQTLDRQNEIVAGGRYLDKFAKDSAGWHIVAREILIDNRGDMRRHVYR